METFTVRLNIELKSWAVTGSVLGRQFIEEDKDVTQKFIQFCSGMYMLLLTLNWYIYTQAYIHQIIQLHINVPIHRSDHSTTNVPIHISDHSTSNVPKQYK